MDQTAILLRAELTGKRSLRWKGCPVPGNVEQAIEYLIRAGIKPETSTEDALRLTRELDRRELELHQVRRRATRPSEPHVSDYRRASVVTHRVLVLVTLLVEGPLTSADLIACAERRTGGLLHIPKCNVRVELSVQVAAGLLSVEPGDDLKIYSLTEMGRELAERHRQILAGLADRLPVIPASHPVQL